MHDGSGYASAKSPKGHDARSLGVYCVFTAGPIIVETAIEAPKGAGVKLHHMTTIRLSGKPNSGINHVINDEGDPVITTRKAVVK
jgi:hypothetical protein